MVLKNCHFSGISHDSTECQQACGSQHSQTPELRILLLELTVGVIDMFETGVLERD